MDFSKKQDQNGSLILSQIFSGTRHNASGNFTSNSTLRSYPKQTLVVAKSLYYTSIALGVFAVSLYVLGVYLLLTNRKVNVRLRNGRFLLIHLSLLGILQIFMENVGECLIIYYPFRRAENHVFFAIVLVLRLIRRVNMMSIVLDTFAILYLSIRYDDSFTRTVLVRITLAGYLVILGVCVPLASVLTPVKFFSNFIYMMHSLNCLFVILFLGSMFCVRRQRNTRTKANFKVTVLLSFSYLIWSIIPDVIADLIRKKNIISIADLVAADFILNVVSFFCDPLLYIFGNKSHLRKIKTIFARNYISNASSSRRSVEAQTIPEQLKLELYTKKKTMRSQLEQIPEMGHQGVAIAEMSHQDVAISGTINIDTAIR